MGHRAESCDNSKSCGTLKLSNGASNEHDAGHGQHIGNRCKTAPLRGFCGTHKPANFQSVTAPTCSCVRDSIGVLLDIGLLENLPAWVYCVNQESTMLDNL